MCRGIVGGSGVRCVWCDRRCICVGVTPVTDPCAVVLSDACECGACSVDPFSARAALNGSTCSSSACNVSRANWASVLCLGPRIALNVSGKCEKEGGHCR